VTSAFLTIEKAYREQVELLYRGGANTVGEQQFTLLYSRACEVAFTFRNIKVRLESNWLVSFNPDVITQGSEASIWVRC
jgi:hypothetical protein